MLSTENFDKITVFSQPQIPDDTKLFKKTKKVLAKITFLQMI